MKHFAPIALILCLSALPAIAQEETPPDDAGQGYDLMQQGAELFLRGLQSQLEPTITDLGNRADELRQELAPTLELLSDQMGEALTSLLATIDDLSYYEMPEILENGDIIIRRKPDAPAYEPSAEEPSAEVDL